MSGFVRAVAEGPDPVRLVELAHRVPLQVQRLLRPEPGVAHLCLLSPTGGILQGDRLEVEIAARRGAHLHVATQSAARVYRMEEDHAEQRVFLLAEEGSYLEYVPHPLILFAEARFHQELRMETVGDGVVMAADVLVPGRLACGERWAFADYRLRVRGVVDGEPVLAEAGTVCPAREAPGLATLAGGTVAGSLYVIGRGTGPLAAELGRAVAKSMPGCPCGATALARGAGALVRVVAPARAACEQALRQAWEVVRRRLLGMPAPTVWGWGAEVG